jgi:hypothetical protein
MKNNILSSCELSGLDDISVKNIFGQRAFSLNKLREKYNNQDICVPNFAAVPISLSALFNKETQFSEMDYDTFAIWLGEQEVIESILKYFPLSPPIVRGTGSLEGSINLSFAGFCKSYIPKKELTLEENLTKGIWTVLNSPYKKYGSYYKKAQKLPIEANNLGLILMDFLSNPMIHLTAYVLDDSYLIRGFIKSSL